MQAWQAVQIHQTEAFHPSQFEQNLNMETILDRFLPPMPVKNDSKNSIMKENNWKRSILENAYHKKKSQSKWIIKTALKGEV